MVSSSPCLPMMKKSSSPQGVCDALAAAVVPTLCVTQTAAVVPMLCVMQTSAVAPMLCVTPSLLLLFQCCV